MELKNGRRLNKMFNVGDNVQVICCKEYPGLVGRIATVMPPEHSYYRNPLKIRISFDAAWQGFFYPCQLIKVNK